MRDCSWVPHSFPGAKANHNFECKSDRDTHYNCIAWAVGKQDKFWWPKGERGYFWPPGLRREPVGMETVENFIRAFKTERYEKCSGGKWDPKYEKIALYTNAKGVPTHAARLLPTGVWTSKLGNLEDIEHNTLQCVEGNVYGTVTMYFRRRLPQFRRTNLAARFLSFLSRVFERQPSVFSLLQSRNPISS